MLLHGPDVPQEPARRRTPPCGGAHEDRLRPPVWVVCGGGTLRHDPTLSGVAVLYHLALSRPWASVPNGPADA